MQNRQDNLIRVRECEFLLQVNRNTMREYLKATRLFKRKEVTWEEVKTLLTLKLYLGIRIGQMSKTEFQNRDPEVINIELQKWGIDIEAALDNLKKEWQKIHKDSVKKKRRKPKI